MEPPTVSHIAALPVTQPKWQRFVGLPLRLLIRPLLLLIIVVSASCGAAQQPADADTDGLGIELGTNPDPPVAGQVELVVTIKDAAQQAVDDAEVNLLASHSAMATMLMQQEAVSTGSGQYRASFDFSQDSQGEWRVTVELRNVQPETIRKNFVITIP